MHTNDLLKGSALLLGASVLSRGSSLFFRYLAAIKLTPDDYGQLSLYISLFLSMSTLASFGIGTSLSKLAATRRDSTIILSILYNNSIILTILTTLITIILFTLILSRTAYELFSFPIIGATATGFFLLSYFQISIGFCLAEMRFWLVSFYESGDGLAKLLIICVASFFYQNLNVILFIYSYTFSYIIMLIISIYNNVRIMNFSVFINPITNYNAKVIKYIFNHSFYLMGVTFSTLFYSFLLRLFLSSKSNTEVALFDMALLFYSFPRMVFASLVRPIVPFASQRRNSMIMLPDLIKIGTFLSIFFITGIFLYKINIVYNLLKYIGMDNYITSFPVFLVLLLGSIFDLSFGYCSSYLQGIGKIRDLFLLTLVVSIITLPLSFLAISNYNVYGAAIANVMYNISLALFIVIYCFIKIGFQSMNK